MAATVDQYRELMESCNMEIGEAIVEYHEITRAFRVESNPDGLLGFLTTVMQKGAEAGEVQGKIAKSIRDDEIWQHLIESQPLTCVEGNIASYIPDERKDAIIAELGDDLFYISEMCNHLGITLYDLMLSNATKLMTRQDKGTLRGAGDGR